MLKVSGSVRVGIIGCGYGARVLVPAFRAGPGAVVLAIAATSRAAARTTARKCDVPHAFGDWREMLASGPVDAVAIAVPPAAQAEIATAALRCGLPVFAEKPLAVNVMEAARLAGVASTHRLAAMIDFNFREVAAFCAARRLLMEGCLGKVRQVSLSWHVENHANRPGIENWKTDRASGGGTLTNFVSHALDYLEWFLGPISGLQARLAGMPNDPRCNDTSVAMALQFVSGAAGSLTMSAAAYRGSGHRIEFYGEDGAMVLANPSADYMRGFTLSLARRPDQPLVVAIESPNGDIWSDGRVWPASRLAARFLDWVGGGPPAEPSFAAGLRVQQLIDAAQRSHAAGRWIDLTSSEAS
jgi:predicted dehydrogenase